MNGPFALAISHSDIVSMCSLMEMCIRLESRQPLRKFPAVEVERTMMDG